MKKHAHRDTLLILFSSLAFFILFQQTGQIVRQAGIQSPSFRILVRYLISIFPLVPVLWMIHPAKRILPSLGLDKRIGKGLALSFVFTLPMLLSFPFIGRFDPSLSWDFVLKTTFLAAFFEETVFRGFMFGQLYRHTRSGFFISSLLPALLFGAGHLYQGNDLLSSASTFLITFAGSILFGWLYISWDRNLWVPIWLHTFMNLYWTLFPMNGNEHAAGNIVSNLIRALCIFLALYMTLRHKKKRRGNPAGPGYAKREPRE